MCMGRNLQRPHAPVKRFLLIIFNELLKDKCEVDMDTVDVVGSGLYLVADISSNNVSRHVLGRLTETGSADPNDIK